MLSSAAEYRRMAAAESRHWWYRSLHEQVVEALRLYCPPADPEILDAGCGTGGMLRYLANRGYTCARGFDLSADAVRHCREHGLDVYQDNLDGFAARLDRHCLDAVISNDTMVYVDAGARRRFVAGCARVLRPGGVLIANAAALEAFRGIHDIAVGARFRLDRGAVRAMFEGGPWQIRCSRYWPFLLTPVIYVVRLRQRILLRRRPGLEARSDLDLPPRWLNALLHELTTLERRVPVPMPWGSSLFTVATRVIERGRGQA